MINPAETHNAGAGGRGRGEGQGYRYGVNFQSDMLSGLFVLLLISLLLITVGSLQSSI